MRIVPRWSGHHRQPRSLERRDHTGRQRTRIRRMWMRQNVNDPRPRPWFHPSVEAQQRRGATDAALATIRSFKSARVLHCDFGITALSAQHDTHQWPMCSARETAGRPRRTPASALANANKLQDIVMARSGRVAPATISCDHRSPGEGDCAEASPLHSTHRMTATAPVHSSVLAIRTAPPAAATRR